MLTVIYYTVCCNSNDKTQQHCVVHDVGVFYFARKSTNSEKGEQKQMQALHLINDVDDNERQQ